MLETSYLSDNLPGSVAYQPSILQNPDALYHTLLQEIHWEKDRIRMYGKDILTRRETAWFGDLPFAYRYSGFTRLALVWHPALGLLREYLRKICASEFNSCLANLYHDGSEGMGWHSDDEDSLNPQAPIASLSLGAERRFLFRLKSNHAVKREFLLGHGSLLLMDAASQQYWQHSLPPARKCRDARINLTFRIMKSPEETVG